MFITKEINKWRLRKRKNQWVALCNKFLVLSAFVILSTASIAKAAPTGGVITNGSGSISQVESATNINQASTRLDINWQTFSTEVHESINFFQPDAISVAINRVIGGVPSELRGALNANGRVFVLNDAGVTFFGTSQINVGALIATTAKDVNIVGDRFTFSGDSYGQVINHGNIHVSDGGFAILAAPHVENTGVIQANLGEIQLASTKDFTVDLRGDGIINFTVSKETANAIVEEGKKLGVDNSGTLQAQSGTIGISANLASNIVQSVVNLSGVVDADALSSEQNGGTVLVTSVGDINITGNIHADGGVGGNGGTIITNADGTNRFESDATITARGGETVGNGGFVEVSGKDIIFRGSVNASAPNGEAGTLLIDPWNLTIADGAGSDSTATVYEQSIETTSQNGTNVVLEADNSITMQDLSDNVLQGGNGNISMSVGSSDCIDCAITFVDKNDKIATTGGSITLTAADGAEGGVGTINIGHLQTTDDSADITVTAGGGGITAGNISTGGPGLGVEYPGNIQLTTSNGGDITVGDISIIADGKYSNTASADLYVDAAGSFNANTIFVSANAAPISESSPYAYANAEMYASEDITVSGNIIVQAAATGGADADTASANANLTVDAGQDINITGNILVDAAATMSGTYYGSNAYASGIADLYADNITINGNITVQASAVNSAQYASSATAYAYLTASADSEIGSLNITGNTLVKADAEVPNSYGGHGEYCDYYGYCYDGTKAYASADADLYAGNMNINGDITVDATALYNASDGSEASANAYLHMDAYDLSISGNILVNADATLVGGTDDADAFASAELYAGNNMTVNGNITVQANALNNSTEFASSAEADADLGMYAGYDLSITGNILVKADVTNYGSDTASASAYANLDAGNNMTIAGDITVLANANNIGGDEAIAYAYLYGDAYNDLTITGNILTQADATLGVNGSSSASAIATADLYAGNNMTINGNINVLATAVHNGTEYSASADADLVVYAENDLTINGNILVKADATMGIEGTDSASASATADLYAGNNMTINGNINVLATAVHNGTEDDASADADLDVYAENDLTINGNILVKADATMGTQGTDSAFAIATADLYAGNNLTISGDVTVQANALNNASDYAEAYALLTAVAANNDLHITGDILVTADASLGSGGSVNANAAAILTGGNDVTIDTGSSTIIVSASAVNEDPYYDANAGAALAAMAGINGEDIISAIESGLEEGQIPSLELLFSDGNLNIVGDISVTADAQSGGSKTTDAFAGALFAGGNDVTIDTDPITVSASALNYGYGNANTLSGLVAATGVETFSITGSYPDPEVEVTYENGDLYITGDVLTTAVASGGNYNSGFASASLNAANDLTVLYGTTPPTASAPPASVQAPPILAENFYGSDEVDSEAGYFYALLEIEAGETVLIEPKSAAPSAPAAITCDECEVVSATEAKGVEVIEPLTTGKDPLNITPGGLVQWATGAGVTVPFMTTALTPDIESAIAAGADPTALLPAPAAGGMGLSAGLDAYSVGGPDFCDQVVNGSCLPQIKEKRK